jgi:hypothetical protein
VADAKNKAALNVSAADVPRVGAVPKLWVAVINSPMNEVHIDWVFAMIFSLKRSCLATSKHGWLFQSYMRGTVDKFFVQPVLNPCGEFVVIIDCTLSLYKQRIVHFAFGCGY